MVLDTDVEFAARAGKRAFAFPDGSCGASAFVFINQFKDNGGQNGEDQDKEAEYQPVVENVPGCHCIFRLMGRLGGFILDKIFDFFLPDEIYQIPDVGFHTEGGIPVCLKETAGLQEIRDLPDGEGRIDFCAGEFRGVFQHLKDLTDVCEKDLFIPQSQGGIGEELQQISGSKGFHNDILPPGYLRRRCCRSPPYSACRKG